MRKIKTIFAIIMFSIFYLSVTAQFNFDKVVTDDKNNHVIQGDDTSHVDWTDQYIEAKGWSVMDTSRFKIPGQAKSMARRGAIVDAQRNLLERIQGIRIVGETVVKDMVTKKDYIYTRLEGVLKGAELIGEPTIEDNIVEVIMRVPIYERKGKEKESFADIIQDGMNVKPFIGDNVVVNEDGEQVVFKFKGEEINPTLFPQIIDDNGNIVLDLSKYYNGKNGKFLKYLNLSKDIAEGTGFEKGAQVINLIQDSEGRFKVDSDKISGNKKINWKKVGTTVAQIGGFILKLI